MGYNLTRYEMETNVIFNAEEKTAVLYSQDKSVMRRMDRLVEEFPDIYKCVAETAIGKTYSFPKKYAMPRRPRIMSEEQKEQIRQRFAEKRAEAEDDEAEDDA